MSQIEKLKKRLLSKPKDFTIDELDRLMLGLGYVRQKSGKTAGSKASYIDPLSGIKFCHHKPHPLNVLKPYVIQKVIEYLQKTGRL